MRRRPRITRHKGSEERTVRPCDQPGCTEPGEHRAPKSRDRLNEYYWFCLEHVRAYNRSWNYYAGMNEQEIEREIRLDTVWRRPSWPLNGGTVQSRWYRFAKGRIGDTFGPFAGEGGREEPPRAPQPPPDSPEGRALRVMGLEVPLTLTRLKARYKELVKQHHPDMNGGDRVAEERLKDINDAYATLRKIVIT